VVPAHRRPGRGRGPQDGAGLTRYGPGQEAVDPRPGDLLLTHRSGLIPRLIRLAERRRFGKREAYWSHCAVVVGPAGTLVEAESRGVVRSPLSKYRPREYELIHVPLARPEAAVAYAEAQVGKAFGYLELFSLGVWLLSGWRLEFRRADHQVCSSLAARALAEGGADVGGDPTFMLPADLARRFGPG